jgi:thioester reductase-like protein
MANVFFTGFPGFLGSELLPRVLSRSETDVAVCVVQSKFMRLARERAAAIVTARPELAARIRLVEGDITRPMLGLAEAVDDIQEIYHLAAVYDLSVKRDVGLRVNLEGTRNVLAFAAAQTHLRRLHYVSTCYVSGRHPGVFTENDLDKSQIFNNYYEETKYLAEVEVQKAMKAGLPATIYRPAVVVGDSTTGATQKFDGPYFVIQWILRQPRIAFLPVIGRPSQYRFNVVPRDFVIDAIDYLSSRTESAGKVYQLADPDPMTIDELLDAIAAATQHTILRVPLTRGIAKASLDYVPGVYRLMRIPSAAVDYFVHPTQYDTTNAARDLAGSGIAAPRFRDYLPRLVDFVRAHPEIGSAAMV